MKFGLWLGIALVAFLWFNHAKKQRLKTRNRAGAVPRPPAAETIESMVACTHCGLHVPASDASRSDTGVSFCSVAHRRLHHTQPPA